MHHAPPCPHPGAPRLCAATDRRRARATARAPAGRPPPHGNGMQRKRSARERQEKWYKNATQDPAGAATAARRGAHKREGAARPTGPRRGGGTRATPRRGARPRAKRKRRGRRGGQNPNAPGGSRAAAHPGALPRPRTQRNAGDKLTHTKGGHPSKISGQSHTHKRGRQTRVDCKKKGRWSPLGRASTRRRAASEARPRPPPSPARYTDTGAP